MSINLNIVFVTKRWLLCKTKQFVRIPAEKLQHSGSCKSLSHPDRVVGYILYLIRQVGSLQLRCGENRKQASSDSEKPLSKKQQNNQNTVQECSQHWAMQDSIHIWAITQVSTYSVLAYTVSSISKFVPFMICQYALDENKLFCLFSTVWQLQINYWNENIAAFHKYRKIPKPWEVFRKWTSLFRSFCPSALFSPQV